MIFRKVVLRIFLYLILILLIIFSILISKIYNQSMINEVKKADAIVVLGASQWDGSPSPVFKARLDHGFGLYKDDYAPKMILTGGINKKDFISDSSVAKDYLVQKGVAEKDIYIEQESHTSWQNLIQVKQILERQNLNSVILVSDGFHMMRLKKMAIDLDIKFFTSPVIESPIAENKITEFKYILREAIVYVGYLLFKV